MDDAAIRKRCEEILKQWWNTMGDHDPNSYLYRAAYADGQRDGMERAAKIADIEMENHAAPHDWMARLAARTISEQIRQAAGEEVGE